MLSRLPQTALLAARHAHYLRTMSTFASWPTTVAAHSALTAPLVDALYRPFLLAPEEQTTDWVADLELDSITSLSTAFPRKLKLLVLYGSLRERFV